MLHVFHKHIFVLVQIYNIYVIYIYLHCCFFENKSRKRLLRQTNSVIEKSGMHEIATS